MDKDPSHYTRFKVQPMDFCIANDLSFPEGNVVKYICRYKYKDGIKDLKKIIRNVQFIIDNYETQ